MALVVLAAAYLVGTFPTAQLVARAYGRDPTREGSGNPGASNVYRVAGRKAGIAVFVGDLVKGVLAAAVGLAVGGRPLAYAAGVAAVVGHCFPAQRRFRGGKGVAAAAGVVTMLEPFVAVAAALIWLLVARVFSKASLASLAVAAFVPTAVVVLGRPAVELWGVAALALVVLVRHAPNIVRLLRGEERSLHGEAA